MFHKLYQSIFIVVLNLSLKFIYISHFLLTKFSIIDLIIEKWKVSSNRRQIATANNSEWNNWQDENIHILPEISSWIPKLRYLLSQWLLDEVNSRDSTTIHLHNSIIILLCYSPKQMPNFANNLSNIRHKHNKEKYSLTVFCIFRQFLENPMIDFKLKS